MAQTPESPLPGLNHEEYESLLQELGLLDLTWEPVNDGQLLWRWRRTPGGAYRAGITSEDAAVHAVRQLVRGAP